VKKYVEIEVRIGGTIAVDADTDEQAIELAKLVAQNRFMKFSVGVSPPYPDVIVFYARPEGGHETCREAPEDTKTETYVCNHCKRSSPKEDFGPGRVKCPKCRMLQLSVADVALLDSLPKCTCAYGQIGWPMTHFTHMDDCPWSLVLWFDKKKMLTADGRLVDVPPVTFTAVEPDEP
jgi:hypothetical protein